MLILRILIALLLAIVSGVLEALAYAAYGCEFSPFLRSLTLLLILAAALVLTVKFKGEK